MLEHISLFYPIFERNVFIDVYNFILLVNTIYKKVYSLVYDFDSIHHNEGRIFDSNDFFVLVK